MAKHTIEELYQWQGLPLNIKVLMTKNRIRQWVNEYGEDGVYVSFSGGKDSTVLLHLVRSTYPKVKAVFVDTGLEYPEIRAFVKTFDNVEWLKPKMNFKEVISKYGYPFISKEVSECVESAYRFFNNYCECNIDKYPARVKKLLGILEHKEKGVLTNESSKMYDRSRYNFLLDAPFILSSRCCNVMKKTPTHLYSRLTSQKPMTAQMASESRIRAQKWLQNGCNGFDMKEPISNPMAFWTEQDVLLYIKQNNLKIASVYGEIVSDNDLSDALEGQMELCDLSADLGIFEIGRPLLKTTGCDRTGCAFCGYGCHLEKPEESRWEISKKVSNPNIVDFCMRGGAFDENGLWNPNETGLGYWFVMKWMNVHGNMNFYIPDYEMYEREYGTDETRKHLEATN